MSTRSSDKFLQVLPVSPGHDHLEISGSKLPSHEQVLLCVLSHMKILSKSHLGKRKAVREASKAAMEQVHVHYNNAKIMTLSNSQICRKIENLYYEFASVRRLPKNRIKSSIRHAFQEKLSTTFPAWPKDILEQMERSKKQNMSRVEKEAIEEDMQFVISMQTDRKASYIGVDKVISQIEENKTKNRKRVRDEEGISHSDFITVDAIPDDGIDMPVTMEQSGHTSNSSKEDACPRAKRAHVRQHKTGTHIFVPHDIMKNASLVSIYARNGVSPTAMSSILHTLIEECGGDPSCVSLSYATANR